MSKLATSVLPVESSLFLLLFKKKRDGSELADVRPTERPMATNKRKKEDVNEEATEKKNSFSLFLSFSPFLTHQHFFLEHSLVLRLFLVRTTGFLPPQAAYIRSTMKNRRKDITSSPSTSMFRYMLTLFC